MDFKFLEYSISHAQLRNNIIKQALLDPSQKDSVVKSITNFIGVESMYANGPNNPPLKINNDNRDLVGVFYNVPVYSLDFDDRLTHSVADGLDIIKGRVYNLTYEEKLQAKAKASYCGYG